MGRALLLALTCAAAVSAASYDDYSAIKMPQYGGGAEYDIGRDPSLLQTSDDYRGHSPDPPASPDYKYEEEPRVKTEKHAKELHYKKTWRRPGRKQRELVRSAESDTNLRTKYNLDDEDDEIPKFRTNRRSIRHRSRLKHDIADKEEDMPVPRRQNKFSRDRKAISDLDRKDYSNVDKDYISDDKNKDFDDGNKFNSGDEPIEGSDRNIKKPKSTFDDYDEDVSGKHVKGEYDVKPVFPEDDIRFNRPVALRKLPGQIYPPTAEEDEESKSDQLKVIPGRFKLKGYNEYDDYYDLKRANNVKKRLPSLLRRTTVITGPKKSTNMLDMLMPNRRMMWPTVNADRATTDSGTVVTHEVITTTMTIATTTTSRPPLKVPAELSLAEKSRLSILKKAQRKEGQSFRSTKKPPVLLQVTSVMPTVVMVEPPSSTIAWMRAREEEDTPMRLEVVKRLMRQKIVKEAKSIHDLTDNWDDMVCDYIDMSLLENFTVQCLPNNLLLIIIQIFVFVIRTYVVL